VPSDAGRLRVHPAAQALFARLGLTRPADLLTLAGPVVSGHPDRHVRRVELGCGPTACTAYLKVEHRVPWRDRLRNAVAGFGMVSKSLREAAILDALERDGLPGPRWLAAGTDGRGRAFLLVRSLEAAAELRDLLRATRDPARRRALAVKVGVALGRLVASGYLNPDLHVKHVWMANGGIVLLDWQRGTRPRRLLAARVGHGRANGSALEWQPVASAVPSVRALVRPLAMLHATLAPALATPRERLSALRSLVRVAGLGRAAPLARAVVAAAVPLAGRRAVREAHRPPLPTGTQELVWLDGEALCATPGLARLVSRPALEALAYPGDGPAGSVTVALPFGRRATLTRRRVWAGAARVAAWLRGRSYRSPEVRAAGDAFNRQRLGLPAPQLLAFGQRLHADGRVESFLMVEESPAAAAAGVRSA
jgi:hypothetical protein